MASALPEVLELAAGLLGSRPLRKCLIYCPDAIGLQLCDDFASFFASVQRVAPLGITLRSMLPPKTPVCFASMFTGAEPAAHGITAYAKPVLSCDTLFDAMLRAGKSIAIVAVADSSIDRIFRNRAMDYYSEPYDPQVTDRALQLIGTGQHDLLVVYHQEYDDSLHASGPRSEASIRAMHNHIRSFELLTTAFHEAHGEHDRAVFFCPDHGGHATPDGRGTHGEDIPEDMLVRHFFGMAAGSSSQAAQSS